MLITKNKNYNQFSISDLKDQLQIDETDFTYDNLLQRLLKTSCAIAEDYVDNDIVPTTATLEENSYLVPLVYLEYPIYTTNININSVQYSTGFGTGQTLITMDKSNYAVEKFSNYTNIRFHTSLSCNRLLINYSSGSSTIPEPVKQAIYMKVGELMNSDRNNYVASNIVASKAFERILAPYKNVLY